MSFRVKNKRYWLREKLTKGGEFKKPLLYPKPKRIQQDQQKRHNSDNITIHPKIKKEKKDRQQQGFNQFVKQKESKTESKIKTINFYHKIQLSRSQKFVGQFRKIVLFEQITNKFQSLLPHLFLRRDFDKFSDVRPVASCIIFQVLSMVPDQTTHSILVNKLITYLQILTKETLLKSS
ncbi:hypothetical protein M0813_07889 [Anaeramoeba flamelloides]|uniref:Uncharacterized protein n=1 Tax=Anaeramoeba flamelloides TaxID=1746091 RepID=A0ABQ8X9A1_9EUKA|nr:hypothetical protein M0813_07889 [Anaeramoeba flamelloides]